MRNNPVQLDIRVMGQFANTVRHDSVMHLYARVLLCAEKKIKCLVEASYFIIYLVCSNLCVIFLFAGVLAFFFLWF